MIFSFSARSNDLQSFDLLETQLFSSFQPVEPNPVFVNRLKTNLINSPAVILEDSKASFLLLIVGLSLFGGVFLTWMVHKIWRLCR